MANSITQPPSTHTTEAWTTLSRWLPSRDKDSDYWWKKTGPPLALMLDAAGYPIHEQYEALLFHYGCTAPLLGPAPAADGKLFMASTLCDGMPMEFAWKWNNASNRPIIQYALEAMNGSSGTEMDPLNQDAAREFLRRVKASGTYVDLSWANHFFSILYDHDRLKHVKAGALELPRKSTLIQGVEFFSKALRTKSYFVPRKLSYDPGQLPLPQWEESIAHFDPENEARNVLFDFVRTHPEGQSLRPTMVASDNNVEPAKSRLKLYFVTPHSSFASVRDIVTLGGKRIVPEKLMQDFRSLIAAVVGLDSDFDDNAELPLHSCTMEDVRPPMRGYAYNFDIGPGGKVPAVKCYLPTRYRGGDDRTLAHNLTEWMTAHGRGKYCKQYLSMLEGICQHRRLEEGKDVQYWISCMIGKDDLEITSYMPTPPATDSQTY
ncbi:hypothetical protein HIM_08262 [Hirsutella minnesotensis 3608]|uniref:Aromatic prenyltransferase n=1 Tax=Hirsutella minnesotensis 3608 TaxID=1043627 RepID=A0A0F7ZHB2_9HYPO|nr:hypothetical protein HIM_08262 [Hirsutella minnesotensis 3608]